MSPTRLSPHTLATIAALVVTFLWSSSWVLIRWGLDDEALPPLTFAGLRYGVAALVLLVLVVTRAQSRRQLVGLGRRSSIRIAGLGLVFYAVTQGAQFVAIDNQPAATTSLVLSLTPFLVAVLAGVSLGEVPTVRQVGGAVLLIAGAFAYFSGNLGATFVGMIAALVGLGANVTSTLLGRQVNRSREAAPVVVTGASMAVGAAVLLAAGLLIEGAPSVSARAWLIVGWLAAVNTALAFTLWNLSLRRLAAVESAAINNTMLIQIAVLGWLFLEEAPGPAGIVGILLVSAGVFLVQTVTVRRKPAAVTDQPASGRK